jgi:hypothetical protein
VKNKSFRKVLAVATKIACNLSLPKKCEKELSTDPNGYLIWKNVRENSVNLQQL